MREMSESSFWIMTVLASGRLHGYGLMAEAERASRGRVRLKVATLYTALDRLGREGFVQLDGEEAVDGRLRRYFRLTEEGGERLEQEASRLEANAREARTRLSQRLA
jgi:DNA-binding PadR family transcriptional regulator